MFDTIYLTYDQWKRLGFFVKKGEKNYKKGGFGPVFSEEQVDTGDEEYSPDEGDGYSGIWD